MNRLPSLSKFFAPAKPLCPVLLLALLLSPVVLAARDSGSVGGIDDAVVQPTDGSRDGGSTGGAGDVVVEPTDGSRDGGSTGGIGGREPSGKKP